MLLLSCVSQVVCQPLAHLLAMIRAVNPRSSMSAPEVFNCTWKDSQMHTPQKKVHQEP